MTPADTDLEQGHYKDIWKRLREHDKRFDKIEKQMSRIYKPVVAIAAMMASQIASNYLHLGK